jgi:MarR family transcriptional regulator, transcriptional regulator for hemolysin
VGRDAPLGLHLATSARLVERAFDDALAAAGGSRPVWLALLAIKTRSGANQREIAASVGVQGPTLTHHLNAMERDGLIRRRRDDTNRRVHVVELTNSGEAAFDRLRATATAFDRRLRRGLTEADTAELRRLLDRLGANAASAP